MADLFADVILPLPLYSSFTYSVPDYMQPDIQTGSRVLVQFGRKKFYTAIVEKVHTVKPEYEVKPIMAEMDSRLLPLLARRGIQGGCPHGAEAGERDVRVAQRRLRAVGHSGKAHRAAGAGGGGADGEEARKNLRTRELYQDKKHTFGDSASS